MSALDVAKSIGLTVVVAHYNEDLQWLTELEERAVVYSKGDPTWNYQGAAHWTNLPNIGREAHTYLYHIVHHYHDLSPITLFTQAGIEDSVEYFRDIATLCEALRRKKMNR